MERELFRLVMRSLPRAARRRDNHQVYSDAAIVAVAAWSAIHDRSIHWGCQRGNWPMQAWRRRLPDQSTMSRRLRSLSVTSLLSSMLMALRCRHLPSAPVAIMDAKALPLSRNTADPDALNGWGDGRFARGYKLHTLVDPAGRVLAWSVHPMNIVECTAAGALMSDARRRGVLADNATVLADAGYDSNPLHAEAARLNIVLIAPRKKPGTGLAAGTPSRHHPGRLRSIVMTEKLPSLARRIRASRIGVERFFSRLTGTGGGLTTLPAWIRRLSRVRLWVALKLIIHQARLRARSLARA